MRSRGGTAVLELLAAPARAIIIAADPGRCARCRGFRDGAPQEKIDVREIFGLVRLYADDYLPVVSFTKRDDLFAFGVGGGEKGYQFGGREGAMCGVTLWPAVGAEIGKKLTASSLRPACRRF